MTTLDVGRRRPESVFLVICALISLAVTPQLHADTQPRAVFEALQQSGNEDPAAWLELAVAAREAGDLELAARSLQSAENHGLTSFRAGLERARQRLSADDRSGALAELQALFEGGFNSVDAIRQDPLLNRLSGDPTYAALLASMEARAFPCEHGERFQDFNFWLGNWDVHLANGTFAGTNRVRSAERGCVLLEEWTSATGGTGRSINYFDAASGEWVQVWNDAGGSQISIRGGLTESGMRLSGQIHYVSSGLTAPFRGVWTPLPDGRVRQFFEQASADGTGWTPWFEGFYSRQESQ